MTDCPRPSEERRPVRSRHHISTSITHITVLQGITQSMDTSRCSSRQQSFDVYQFGQGQSCMCYKWVIPPELAQTCSMRLLGYLLAKRVVGSIIKPIPKYSQSDTSPQHATRGEPSDMHLLQANLLLESISVLLAPRALLTVRQKWLG